MKQPPAPTKKYLIAGRWVEMTEEEYRRHFARWKQDAKEAVDSFERVRLQMLGSRLR